MDRVVFDTEASVTKWDDEDWTDYHRRAGVSVACVIDAATGFPTFYTETDDPDGQYGLWALVRRLEEADEVISYNGKVYDVPVIEWAVTDEGFPRYRLRLKRHIDLYDRIKEALEGERWPRGSWTLDAVAHRCLGNGKSANGAFAPTLMREKRLGELFTYNLKDVWLTWKLTEFAEREGYLLNPEGKRLPVIIA